MKHQGNDLVREQGSTVVPDEGEAAPERELGVTDQEAPEETEEAGDPVAEMAQRELGTELPHEIRGDGSIAYFGSEDARERAEQANMPRERGTDVGGTQ